MAPAGVSREAAPSSPPESAALAEPADEASTGASPSGAGDGSGAGAGAGDSAGEEAVDYLPPAVFDLGSVWRVTLGSSSNGSADANSHYYW